MDVKSIVYIVVQLQQLQFKPFFLTPAVKSRDDFFMACFQQTQGNRASNQLC